MTDGSGAFRVSAGADTTGSIGPFANPRGDAPGITLAYADQTGSDATAAPDAPTGIDALRAAAIPARQVPQIGTTIAIKRGGPVAPVTQPLIGSARADIIGAKAS